MEAQVEQIGCLQVVGGKKPVIDPEESKAEIVYDPDQFPKVIYGLVLLSSNNLIQVSSIEADAAGQEEHH